MAPHGSRGSRTRSHFPRSSQAWAYPEDVVHPPHAWQPVFRLRPHHHASDVRLHTAVSSCTKWTQEEQTPQEQLPEDLVKHAKESFKSPCKTAQPPPKRLKQKRLTMPSVGRAVKPLILSHTPGGNARGTTMLENSLALFIKRSMY